MDIVTDLTSQCVSFITVAQETYKQQLSFGPYIETSLQTILAEIESGFQVNLDHCDQNLKDRISELLWSSKGMEKDKIKDQTLLSFFATSAKLLEWVNSNAGHMDSLPNLYSTAYEWRTCVRSILYQPEADRISLVRHLEYMPVQIIFCLGSKGLNAEEQRMYQLWEPKGELNPLSEGDKKKIRAWWNADYKPADQNIHSVKEPRAVTAQILLANEVRLLDELIKEDNPLPFENIFIDELTEIESSRLERRKIGGNKNAWTGSVFFKEQDETIYPTPPIEFGGDGASGAEIRDPYIRAKAMNLYGLAFSGGGIRSATFNLGILQKMAEMGILPRFDYLSTVSGGGYIGSWWISWIKRSGSLGKVADRLNPKRSSDPMADEVRPVRWLRMFSNYLAPNSSIMSDDSWTMGMTWLRNTLINQVLLLMLLCSALAFILGIFGIWELLLFKPATVNQLVVIIASGISLLSGAILAGWGMHAFGPEHPPQSFGLEKNNKLYSILMAWGIICTFVISAWLFSHSFYKVSISEKLFALRYSVVIGFASFILVAWLGRYDKCAPDKKPGEIIFYIAFSSLVAAAVGCICLCLSWQLLEKIECIYYPSVKDFNDRLAFVVGVPLVMESISITVVVRMTIMGILFPDLRREWWGRMGAKVHRFMFIWLLIATSALILPDYLSNNYKRFSFPAIFGGWSVIIGYAVKLAYSSESPSPQSDKGSLPIGEIFIRFAPYLFAVGFLLLGSLSLKYLETLITNKETWTNLLIGLALGLVTLFISYRAGVNEFSLHHFYRNRLVRAYLGATRRREAREKTVNNFTNFDQKDDLLLTSLSTSEKYYGPYPVINTTLNSTVVTDLDRQDRKAESFVFTPKYCGFDVRRTRPSTSTGIYEYGYRPTKPFAYPEGPHLGTAMTISGAAVSPNMGFHSSPATAFLLTIFNVRLGWWIGNPRTSFWKSADPWSGIVYLINDLIGRSDIKSKYVYLSDGGHFDNMGLYELIRRRCCYIVLCDAEEDGKSICEGLANAIRKCRVDFGVEISILVNPIIKKDKDSGYCNSHIVEGTIWYPGDGNHPSGTLIYIKTSLTGKESIDIREYFMENPAFPQQPTADQFFDESQFESYRKLGYESLNS